MGRNISIYGTNFNFGKTCFEAEFDCRVNIPGLSVFAVQNSNQCFTVENAIDTYKTHGVSVDCKDDGTGGSYANNVYQVRCGKLSSLKIFNETNGTNFK